MSGRDSSEAAGELTPVPVHEKADSAIPLAHTAGPKDLSPYPRVQELGRRTQSFITTTYLGEPRKLKIVSGAREDVGKNGRHVAWVALRERRP